MDWDDSPVLMIGTAGIGVIVILFLGAYAIEKISENTDVYVNSTTLVTSAPDGTQLWKYQGWSHSYPIYFSKSGTQTTENYQEGKITRQRKVEVPSD